MISDKPQMTYYNATNCNVCRYAASLPAPLLWCTMSQLKLVPTYTAWWTEARARETTCPRLLRGSA